MASREAKKFRVRDLCSPDIFRNFLEVGCWLVAAHAGAEVTQLRCFSRVDMDSRIALVGTNGIGKSTLMKLMAGVLKETGGYVERHRKIMLARCLLHFHYRR